MKVSNARQPRRDRSHSAALLLLACALAGCGGGGSGGGGEEIVKSWSAPERISFANGNVAAPELAADPSGNATAIFRDHDGTAWGATVNRYSVGSGWGTPQRISTTPADPTLSNVDVAAAPSGDVVAVWTQVFAPVNTINSAWTSRLPAGGTWTAAQTLDNYAGQVSGVCVALDASGFGTAAWVQQAAFPAVNDDLGAANTSATGFWSAPFSIPDEPTDVSSSLAIAAQPTGRVYVAWSQGVGSGISLFASWSEGRSSDVFRTELVDTLSPPAGSPDLAVTASGTAFLVWTQAVNDGDPLQIWARRRPDSDALNAWEAPLPLNVATGGHARSPRVAVDDAGNAIAVWQQEDGAASADHSIWYSRYLAGAAGWQQAQPLETAGGDARSPRIAMTPAGEAFAVWRQRESGSFRVWAAHFVPGSGWEAPVRIENDVGKIPSGPTVAVDNSGNAFAVWALSDPANSGVAKVWATQYR